MLLTERDVIANGVRLHVYRTGTGNPPLVFAHGITDNGLCFLPVAEQLADEFEIVLYDSRGHGRSDPSSRETTLVERARDLSGLISALGLRRPALLGHSLGGTTVALCAGLFPQLPGRIVLEDPAPFEAFVRAGDQDREQWARWREWCVADQQRSVEELVEVSRQRDPGWPEVERLPWARAKKQFSLAVFDEEQTEDAESLRRIAARIICPTLLLTPDEKLESMFAPGGTAALAASLPGAKQVGIPGAGHNIRRDQPDLYLDAVRGFLKQPS
jgi:N-formylmaleamate deformylase